MNYESLREKNEDDQSFSNYEGDQSMPISEDGNQSILSEGEQRNLSETSFNENVLKEDILEESEPEMNADYLNEAYADLMALVTKHNISNKTGNAIIKFFNKHANFTESPLPKSIEQGRKYMDNMNLSTLSFIKTHVRNYNDNDYYLHHRSLINCIKNVLSIPDISQNFALTFEKLEVFISIIMLSNYTTYIIY